MIKYATTSTMECNGSLETRAYRKPTDTGLLLHYKSHYNARYKKSL